MAYEQPPLRWEPKRRRAPLRCAYAALQGGRSGLFTPIKTHYPTELAYQIPRHSSPRLCASAVEIRLCNFSQISRRYNPDDAFLYITRRGAGANEGCPDSSGILAQ